MLLVGLIVSTVKIGLQQDILMVDSNGRLLLLDNDDVMLLVSHLVAVVISTEVLVVTVVSVETQLVFTVTDCVTVDMMDGDLVLGRDTL